MRTMVVGNSKLKKARKGRRNQRADWISNGEKELRIKKKENVHTHTHTLRYTHSSGRGVCMCVRGGLCVKEENAKMSFSSAIF